MTDFQLRTDAVELEGTVVQVWIEPHTLGSPLDGTWHLVVQLQPGDPLLLSAEGGVNPFDWIDCSVTPVAPFRSVPQAARLLGEVLGQKVRIAGSWGDATELGLNLGTRISPVTWIVVDRGITAIVEEHGFSQAVRDVDVFAFSDDTPWGTVPAHHREDRHVAVQIPFPFPPQPSAVPAFAECVDREDLEQVLCGFRAVSTPAFPIHSDRQHSVSIAGTPSGHVLMVNVDTGTPAAGQGFFYAKFAITYEEPFEEMCDPDVCLSDPGLSCQYTGETRLSYEWPRLSAVLAGELLLGPAGGKGVLGRLLGALQPAQRYDHMAIFVEDDGRSVRHCTASDERIAAEAYYTANVTVKSPFGTVSKRLPLQGIRNDILRFAWPGSISQSLGEVCLTGSNRQNSQFSFATLYPEVVSSEAAAPPRLWQLVPAERTKRTAFHDPEAVGTAKREKNADERAHYALARLQKDPAFRAEIDPTTKRVVGWIAPILVKPHPLLAAAAQQPLRAVAIAAKNLAAHYRFFSYTDASIATNPSFDAPPAGAWGPRAGADWPARTKAAVCSSFVWAAVQAANQGLAAAGKPTIVLEGEAEPEDERPAAAIDGLYDYARGERGDAAQQLFAFTHDRVVEEVDNAIEQLPGLATALLDLTGASGVVDNVKEGIANIVANQLCNVFAFDTAADLASTWTSPATGVAVSPDDTMLRWDARATPGAPPPPPSPMHINVYGNPLPIQIPEPGWRMMPIYRVRKSTGNGTISGTVVRRTAPSLAPIDVAGATVRFGCEATTTVLGNRGFGWRFLNHKAGRYHLQASQFVIDPTTNVGQEWKSKPEDIELSSGDNLNGVVLELRPPPGVARTVDIRSHHDIVDRVVVGKDRWGHPDLDGKIHLAFDPLDVPAAPPEQQNTRLSDSWDQTTPEVGSGVHVRVIVRAALRGIPGPGGSVSYDGSISCDATLIFFDTGEGETNGTVQDLGFVLQLGDSREIPYNLVSDDTVPERASGVVTVTNLLASLP